MAKQPKSINLALQGGGAHGAFTWGAIERLLDEEIEIVGISATSAGAMNAAAIKCGWHEGGKEGVRRKLAEYWQRIGDLSRAFPNLYRSFLQFSGPFSQIFDTALKANPLLPSPDDFTRYYSPYHSNPLGMNPLKALVEECFDPQLLCREDGPKLFLNATNVRSGRAKVFFGEELSHDAILASAALPYLFQAVEIVDPKTGIKEAYWDGGYTGNPALFPLIDHTDCLDFVIVHINPLCRDEIPQTTSRIDNRINEISFNASLLREMRMIDYVARLIKEGKLPGNEKKSIRLHSIADDDLMGRLDSSSKIFTSPELLEELRIAGQKATDSFFETCFVKVGKETSFDLKGVLG